MDLFCNFLIGNRWRRRKLPDELKEEVYPKNILMVGPTGCGKTEVSGRSSWMADKHAKDYIELFAFLLTGWLIIIHINSM